MAFKMFKFIEGDVEDLNNMIYIWNPRVLLSMLIVM